MSRQQGFQVSQNEHTVGDGSFEHRFLRVLLREMDGICIAYDLGKGNDVVLHNFYSLGNPCHLAFLSILYNPA